MDEALTIEVPGTDFTENFQTFQLLAKVRDLCGWRQESFPGSQPVSLTRTNLRELGNMPYVACEKTDGVRYLLYAVSNVIFLIDRMQTVKLLKYHMPKKYDPASSQQHTLLDGELVTDIVKECGGVGEPKKRATVRYLIYDAIILDGGSVCDCNLLERLRRVYLNVIQPRQEWERENPESVAKEKASNNYIDIYLKDFFEIWDVQAIAAIWPKLPHLSDGIIFTPVNLPYVPGTCQNLLKWKPPHLNSVDFLAEMMTADRFVDLVGKVENNTLVAVRLYSGFRGIPRVSGHWLALIGPKWEQIAQKFIKGDQSDSFKIWECSYDFEAKTVIPLVTLDSQGNEILNMQAGTIQDGGWYVERIRTDRTTPNDSRVVERVLESISDGVSFEELVETFKRFREDGQQPAATFCQMGDSYLNQRLAVEAAAFEKEKSLEIIKTEFEMKDDNNTVNIKDGGEGSQLNGMPTLSSKISQDQPPNSEEETFLVDEDEFLFS